MTREPVEFNVQRNGDGALLEVAGGLDAGCGSTSRRSSSSTRAGSPR
jgi:hypothetical protein